MLYDIMAFLGQLLRSFVSLVWINMLQIEQDQRANKVFFVINYMFSLVILYIGTRQWVSYNKLTSLRCYHFFFYKKKNILNV